MQILLGHPVEEHNTHTHTLKSHFSDLFFVVDVIFDFWFFFFSVTKELLKMQFLHWFVLAYSSTDVTKHHDQVKVTAKPSLQL